MTDQIGTFSPDLFLYCDNSDFTMITRGLNKLNKKFRQKNLEVKGNRRKKFQPDKIK